ADAGGGKNASLGEMIGRLAAAGIRVPGGFATTAQAYRAFLAHNRLEERIRSKLDELAADAHNLAPVGKAVREMILDGEFPDALAQAIAHAYRRLGARAAVAVRSSATAEDLPEASFAGQLESFLNVQGEDAVLDACRRCYASLFTDRAIVYRRNHGFEHMKVALSVGVQRMVRAERAGAGVMFTLDTESGFPRTVLLNAAWGLGEAVVQGMVEPDEYHVFKPLLEDPSTRPIVGKSLGAKTRKMTRRGLVDTTRAERAAFVLADDEVLELARWACAIERHYGQPMDIEWAKDAPTGALYVVQARPETVQARRSAGRLRTFRIGKAGRELVRGLAIGESIAAGRVCRLQGPEEIGRFPEGAVLVTGNTDPDWVPIMKKAAAIVTEHGGRTSHAAIVSRELGVTAVVGAKDARRVLAEGQEVTVSCAEGEEGRVYEGRAEFAAEDIDLDAIPATRTQVMINQAEPASAFQWWRLPADGVGLARMEFIVGTLIRVHPMALVHFDALEDRKAKKEIERLARGYADKTEYFVDTLARGLARIAAAHYPKPVIVRTSDFKTNEYARLVGGAAFEPKEENPMLGWRGASRYYSEGYREGFGLECRALARARETLGFRNIVVMIPFCRTPEEADRVLAEMARHNLKRGAAGLQVYVMCEIPANVVLAAELAERFDGFSIGSNDLTQLVLGVDRDSETLSALFDERHPAVTRTIAALLAQAKDSGTHTGICGQAPSTHPEFAAFLVAHGIDSISVTPDSFVAVKRAVARAEGAS
ncbi:MAG TPA: phosphoenolpyruvate synthase, partial [Burkholderiales bacterium]|nr:phosphoenolpyruvate synthase [Burkholderiales bacterium]